jgi:hypothetical protein
MVFILLITSLFAGWYSPSWTYQKSITLDRTKVVNSTQTNFPVLIDVTSAQLVGNVQADGDDILFTAVDGTTKLDHQIEYFNNSTGKLTAWVRIPSLSHLTDTVIYLYYGNALATSQQNPTAVWDAGYRAVWHFDDAGEEVYNSKSNDFQGTANDGVSFGVTGKIGTAASFDGSSGYVDFGDVLDMGYSDRTASVWFKTSTNRGSIFSKSHIGPGMGRWTLVYEDGSLYSIFQGIEGANNWRLVQWTFPNYADDEWHNITIVYDRSADMTTYVDGVSGLNVDITNGVATDMQSDDYFYIGRYQNSEGTAPATETSWIFNGLIDEMRISDTVRSADWIATEYNNQSSPSTFIKEVGEETLPVELSSFTAIAQANFQVNLQWITQSETNVMGFYIFRNTMADFGSAIQVSNMIPASNTSQQQVYAFTDTEVSEGTYAYWLQNIDFSGHVQFHGPVFANVQSNNGNGIPDIPLLNRLGDAYPNPFEGSTTIKYGLEKSASVTIDIFNTKGQLVRSYQEHKAIGGNYTLDWDAKDMQGNTVTNGLYLYRMKSGVFSSTKKVIVLK